jgi:hypothetical protein
MGIGGLIHRAARERNLRQEDLGMLFGKSQAWASRYLTGRDEDEVRGNLLRLYVNQTEAWHEMMTMLGLDSNTMLTMMGVPIRDTDEKIVRRGIPLYDEGTDTLDQPLERVHVPLRATGDVAAVRVHGHHLGDFLPDQALAFVVLTSTIAPGSVALVNLPGLGHCLRRLIEAGVAPMLERVDDGPQYERVEGASLVGVAIARLVPA